MAGSVSLDRRCVQIVLGVTDPLAEVVHAANDGGSKLAQSLLQKTAGFPPRAPSCFNHILCTPAKYLRLSLHLHQRLVPVATQKWPGFLSVMNCIDRSRKTL